MDDQKARRMIAAHPHDDQRRYLFHCDTRNISYTTTDTLVIGCGVAGLRAAIAAAEHGRVMIMTGNRHERANTQKSQGGIAVPIGESDSPDRHLADTFSAGDGLCDPVAARSIIERGEARLQELIDWGLRIDRDGTGAPALGLEGGHSLRRVVHARGDAIGQELCRVLTSRMRCESSIQVVPECTALDILTNRNDGQSEQRAVGAIVLHPSLGLRIILAHATILATGGVAGLYEPSTNAPSITGDGIAMAFRAGVVLRGMEFVQFHPTAFDVPRSPRPLISEAVRGEGARLVDRQGRRIMAGLHPMAELAPRDIVSRRIATIQQTQGPRCVALDARSISDFSSRFPTIATERHRHGIDPSGPQPIPVTPAAHYLVGGIATDLSAEQTSRGYTPREKSPQLACTAPNRLASNSLLEGLVMGEAAGRAAGLRSSTMQRHEMPFDRERPRSPRGHPIDPTGPAQNHQRFEAAANELRTMMWECVGILRDERGLRHALQQLQVWQERAAHDCAFGSEVWKFQNMTTVAALIATAALDRTESIGCHYRTDVPVRLSVVAEDRDQVPNGTSSAFHQQPARSSVPSESAAVRTAE